VAAPNPQAALSRIRQIRLGIMIFVGLFALWWIVEFLTYAGRTRSFDAFDLAFVPIIGVIGWFLYQAWHVRCPQCGNPFFVNPGLAVGFHLSTQCPYCATRLNDLDEVIR
jgi:hypothetical protein